MKSSRLAYLSLFTFVLFITLGTGCKKDKDQKNGTSFMSVKMHDSIGPYKHVFIDMLGAEIHHESGWTALDVNPGIYDLLELTDGVDTIIVNNSGFPAGEVSQMRLILGPNNSIVLYNSVEILNLDVPSGGSSGLKFNIHHNFEPWTAYEVMIDFDVYHSIHQTGSSQYELKPVIKVDHIREI